MAEKSKTITFTLPMTEHDRATLYAQMAKALHNANARRRAAQSQKAQSQKPHSQKAKGGRRSRKNRNRTRKLRR